MIYLITYDKNTIIKNYLPLQKAIKSCGKYWWHHMNNTWLVSTQMNATQIFSILKPHISAPDRILIVQIHPQSDYSGWLNKDAWEWIKKHQRSFPYTL